MTTIATKIPSMEAPRDAIEVAVRLNITTALVHVNDVSPTHDPQGNLLNIFLNPPVRYEQAIIEDMSAASDWPALVVVSSAPRMETAAQQSGSGGGQWRGTVEMYYYDQHDDPAQLTRMLDRYGAALWGIVAGFARFAGWVLDDETFELAYSEVEGSTPEARAVGIRFELIYRT